MGRGIRFTTEFKREAVRLALTSGRPRAKIVEYQSLVSDLEREIEEALDNTR
jgi:transposase-like protein